LTQTPPLWQGLSAAHSSTSSPHLSPVHPSAQSQLKVAPTPSTQRAPFAHDLPSVVLHTDTSNSQFKPEEAIM
jgi:hypothetical protein